MQGGTHLPNLSDRDWKLAFKISLSFFIILFLVWLLIKLAPIITLFLVAILIVYFISPVMKAFIDKKVPPFLAAVLTFMIVLIFLSLLFYAIIPGMLNELAELANYFSDDVVSEADIILFQPILQEIEILESRFNLQITQTISEITTNFIQGLPEYFEDMLSGLGAASIAFFSGIWSFLVLIFVMFYLLIEIEKVKEKFTHLFPYVYHQEVGHVISVIDQKVGAYVRGTIVRCFCVGILTSIVLSIVGMPFALMLGVLAGALNIIVYIGPILAAIPAVLFSLVPGTPHFLLIIGIYLAVQTVDFFVFTPYLLGKAVDLSPLTIVTTVLIGAQLAGLLGIILAIPAAAILKVLLNHYYLGSRETNTS